MQKMSLQQARNVNGGFSFGSLFGTKSLFGGVSLALRATNAATGWGGGLSRLFH